MSFSERERLSVHAQFALGLTPTASAFVRGNLESEVDRALRNVPLPPGMLSRLGRMVLTFADDNSGRIDFLGC